VKRCEKCPFKDTCRVPEPRKLGDVALGADMTLTGPTCFNSLNPNGFEINPQGFTVFIRSPTKCQTCGKPGGVPRVDKGLKAGTHCDKCWESLVSEARSRSW